MGLRVGIQAWGSEGDVRPLIALADRLRREGHAPHLVLSPVDDRDYAGKCRSIGVPLTLVHQRVDLPLDAIGRAMKSRVPGRDVRVMMDAIWPHVEAMGKAAKDLCAVSDVVVGHYLSWHVKAAATASGIPYASVNFNPNIIHLEGAPPPGLPPWRWLHKPGWALVDFVADRLFRLHNVSAFFADMHLPPVRHVREVLISDRLNLVAVSPTLWTPASDSNRTLRVCGDFTYPATQKVGGRRLPFRAFSLTARGR